MVISPGPEGTRRGNSYRNLERDSHVAGAIDKSCVMSCSEGGWGINTLTSLFLFPNPSPRTSRWQDPTQLGGRGPCDAVCTSQCLGVQSMIGRGAEQN